MIEFFKNLEGFAIRTDAATPEEFLEGCAKVLGRMIDENSERHDWEFGLGFWLPQIVDITCSLRGYKADVVTRTVRSAGSSHFMSSDGASATLNERKEVVLHLKTAEELHALDDVPGK